MEGNKEGIIVDSSCGSDGVTFLMFLSPIHTHIRTPVRTQFLRILTLV